jgi:hypothetical protein
VSVVAAQPKSCPGSIAICPSLPKHRIEPIEFPQERMKHASANVIVNKSQIQAKIKPNGELIIVEEDKALLNTRWKNGFINDPAFNPNLTIYHGKPMVSKSPRGSTIKVKK